MACGRFVSVPDEATAGGEPFIQMRGVEKSLGDQQILRGLDLEVFEGETMVLIGGSGGGKSVTLKHIIGLMCPDAGEVCVEG